MPVRVAWAAWVQGLVGLAKAALFITLAVVIVHQVYFGPRRLEAARADVINRFEQERKTRVIALIHRQDTVSVFGVPVSSNISIEDSEAVLRAIRLTPAAQPIDVILHTPGGQVLAAEQIANALSERKAKVTVFVPHYAMSGGTMIALAADEILMDPHAVIGPVDPQLANKDGQFAAASVIKVAREKPIDKVGDTTLMLADDAQKAQDQMIAFMREIMKGKCGEPNTDKIIAELVMGKYTHDYPIFPEQAKELLGDCVKVGIPMSVYELMEFYRMSSGTHRPGVEYIPVSPPGGPQQRR